MPRKPRIHVPGAFYHVTLRGNHRQDIFFSHADRVLMSSIVTEVIDRFDSRVHAFCWMTNHVHLLIQVSDVPLWRLMLRIASRYARQVQKRFHTTGHLFECRYHAIMIDADEYLLTVLRYIHRNPVDAHMVQTVDDYPWSSHHAYLNSKTDAWITTDFALGMFHRDRVQAMSMYRQFVSADDPRAELPLHDLNPNDTRILGCDVFTASAHGLAWKPKSYKTVEQLIGEACAQFNVTREQLASPDKRRQFAMARAWIANQATTLRIASIAHIAKLFGRDESTLRKSIQRHFRLQ